MSRENIWWGARRGISLLEVVFSVGMVSLLIVAINLVFLVTFRAWHYVGYEAELREDVGFGLERLIRDVREAKAISVSNHALRLTRHEASGDQSYIYYLYNVSDHWIPTYLQPLYELRRANLTGGLGGSFTYGAGELIVKNLKPPPSGTTISGSGNLAIVSLDAILSGSEWRTRGYVRPRNIV